MLEKLDKVSLYIAVAIIGYLTYSITEKSSLGIEAEEKLPQITKKMLYPELIDPNNDASPVDRDPFDVEWATYFDFSEFTGQDDLLKELPFDQDNAPPFTKRLMGILTTGNGQNAVLIEGKVYETGSLIDGDNPKYCWEIESIHKNEVVIKFGKYRQILKISNNNQNEQVETDLPLEIEQ
jgi:hypothetical protein